MSVQKAPCRFADDAPAYTRTAGLTKFISIDTMSAHSLDFAQGNQRPPRLSYEAV